MIDSQPGNPAFVHEFEDEAMRRREYFGLFHVDAHQVCNIEEAAVIDLFAGHLPKRQYVRLLRQQVVQQVETARVFRLAIEEPDALIQMRSEDIVAWCRGFHRRSFSFRVWLRRKPTASGLVVALGGIESISSASSAASGTWDRIRP